MNPGMCVPGFTSVLNSPSTSPPRTLTAPNSVIVASGPEPVVSRSTTQKVASASGVPRSSKLGCSVAFRDVWIMQVTLATGSDVFVRGEHPGAMAGGRGPDGGRNRAETGLEG